MNNVRSSTIEQETHARTTNPRELYKIALMSGAVAIAATFLSSVMVTKMTHRAEQRSFKELEEQEQTYRTRIENMRYLATELEHATAETIMRANYKLHAKQLLGYDLTEQEIKVAVLSVLGEPTATIAKQLHISESTVRHALSDTYKKTKTKNRQELRRLIYLHMSRDRASPSHENPS